MDKTKLKQVVNDFVLLSDNKANAIAVQNILHAELTNIFGFKHITFESCNNMKKFTPLSYYCFNFIPSGGIKTKLLQDIDYYFLPWFKDKIDIVNSGRYDQMCKDHDDKLMKIYDKVTRRQKKLEFDKEEKNFVNLKHFISDCTQSKLYQYANIIDKNTEGSIFYIQDEFADYFYDAKISKDSIKNAILTTLLDLYDGTLKSTDTTGTDRQTINSLPASVILMSDYSLIFDDSKLLKHFKLYLKRGIARRSFIFYDDTDDIYDNIHFFEPEEKEAAIERIRQVSQEIKTIYETAKPHYTFSVKANKKIIEYGQTINEKLHYQRIYKQKLPIEDKIININLENSTWKIIKLAVLYHILDKPFNPEVQPEAVEAAIEFFNKTHECLIRLLEQKIISKSDELFNYLLKNINRLVPNAQIREQKFVSNPKFKAWYEEVKEEIINLCKKRGLGFVETVGERNAKHIGIYTSDYRVENNKLVRNSFSDVETDTL